MKLSQFDYNLPPKLIAQKPASPRDSSRLLVVEREGNKVRHAHFFDLPMFLKKGDLLVFNDSKVFPARLLGRKQSGGQAEFLFLKPLNGKDWEVMVRAGNPQIDGKFVFADKLLATLKERLSTKSWRAHFNFSYEKVLEYLNKRGIVPLPPYIDSQQKQSVLKRGYQTVYAKNFGSAAAPTAGLHFTNRLLTKLKKQEVNFAKVTLHVGLGTFEPVNTENIEDFHIHSEFAQVRGIDLRKIIKAKQQHRRIIAVGTTSARVLEYLWEDKQPPSKTWSGDVNLFIRPDFKFKAIDGLITNFHLPKSSLLILLSALLGLTQVKKLYALAVRKKYRFFSFGDVMLILP